MVSSPSLASRRELGLTLLTLGLWVHGSSFALLVGRWIRDQLKASLKVDAISIGNEPARRTKGQPTLARLGRSIDHSPIAVDLALRW